ncbi:ABC transporter ATP-binding protein [Pontibacter anaerobius]|uniref:ABC transporter ATP-binding protein n=1 Tax=Pontibacter anaerobius TaxID=2993940 RepID=A0ABT3RDY2_9BACT|nr:ABC transporter ATP-binding protein [Pontibacter anaerobius]
MDKIKQLLKSNFGSFTYFYSYLGNRIFVSVGLSLLVGVLDGFGLAMFLPLLQMISGSPDEVQSEQMGNLSFLVDGLQYFGFSLTLPTILIVIFIFFTLKGGFKFIEGFYKVILQQKFIRQIRFSNIDLLSGYQYNSFVRSDSGRIQNTITGEVDRLLLAYRSYFTAFQYGILVLVYTSLAFLANPQFAVLVAIGGGLTNVMFKKVYYTTKKLSRNLTNENHAFQGLLIQEVHNFKYLKASGLIGKFGQKLKSSIKSIEELQRRIGVLAALLSSMREPLVMLVVVIVILVQVNIFSHNLGVLILSLLFFYRSLTFLMGLQNFWNTFLSVSGSLENMDEFNKELFQDQEQNGRTKIESFREVINLRNLSFSYGRNLILKNVSLSIYKNEAIALVGESGSGKTTLMNLLCGLLKAEKGDLLVDGIEMHEIDMKSFQNRVGYITQEPVIFSDTVFNNVTFWASPTEENLKRFNEALEMASIADFVKGLPEKENSLLGNNGVLISGGQKQRISIARELYKEIDILFMDEATSALDSETEKSIQQNIEKLKGKYTIVIIAHRLSTIKNVDRIIYLNRGEIEDEGDFESLKFSSTSFNKMVNLQEF